MKLSQRLALCGRILRVKPGYAFRHAQRELSQDDSPMTLRMNQDLLEMVLVFSSQRHSGTSASFARACLDKLLAFEPLSPLTGEPSEWAEIAPGTWQNNRCSRMFKDVSRFNGQAYNAQGRVFREPSGACYTNRDSAVPITFPYTPSTEYVDVPAPGDAELAN